MEHSVRNNLKLAKDRLTDLRDLCAKAEPEFAEFTEFLRSRTAKDRQSGDDDYRAEYVQKMGDMWRTASVKDNALRNARLAITNLELYVKDLDAALVDGFNTAVKLEFAKFLVEASAIPRANVALASLRAAVELNH